MACHSAKQATSQKPARSTTPETAGEPDTRYQQAFFAAIDFRDRGDWQRAEGRFEECISIAPKQSGAPYYELSRIARTVRNNANAALPYARAAVSLAPENPWYRHELADVYLALGKYDLAVKEYQVVERLNPDDPNNLYEQANALLFAGKAKEAIQVYDRLEKKTGVYEELSLEKHHLYLDLKMPKEAGAELEKLAMAFPEEPRFWGMALRFYAGSGMKEKELQALEQLRKSDPSHGMVRFQLSEYYAIMGDERRSYEELRLAFGTTDVGIDKKIGVLLRYYTLTEYNPSFLKEAYELLRITEDVHPAEAKVLSMYADFLYRDGKLNEALTKYKKAVELDPSRSQIWSQLLNIEVALGRFDLLNNDAAQALSLFPSLPELYLYHGMALEKSGQLSDALSQYQIGKELVIDDNNMLAQFYLSMGSVFHALKKFKESDDAFEQALRITPDNSVVLNNYAYFLAERNSRLDKALQMARKCNELEPGRATYMDTYAWVLFQSGQNDEALRWIEKAIQAGGENDADILEHYGDILNRAGRTNEARDRWNKALEKGGPADRIQQKLDGRYSY